MLKWEVLNRQRRQESPVLEVKVDDQDLTPTARRSTPDPKLPKRAVSTHGGSMKKKVIQNGVKIGMQAVNPVPLNLRNLAPEGNKILIIICFGDEDEKSFKTNLFYLLFNSNDNDLDVTWTGPSGPLRTLVGPGCQQPSLHFLRTHPVSYGITPPCSRAGWVSAVSGSARCASSPPPYTFLPVALRQAPR